MIGDAELKALEIKYEIGQPHANNHKVVVDFGDLRALIAEVRRGRQFTERPDIPERVRG